jgi:integrase
MPHHPEPFYRESRRTWAVEIKKKQTFLGRDENPKKDRKGNFVPPDHVLKKYHEVMAENEEAPIVGKTEVIQAVFVLQVLDEFLDWVKRHREPRTAEWYERHLQTFADSISKTLRVDELKPYHLTKLCDSHDDWSPTTKHGLCRAVQRAFRWAEDQGMIDRTPLRKVEKPEPESRDVLVEEEEYQKILELTKGGFRDLLIVAWNSGARPRELRIVEARHVDPENSRFVFPKKQAKGKKAPRIVYLNDEAMVIVKRYMALYPTGPLFRNADGQPWKRYAINCAFIRLEKKIGRKLHLGAFRHSFATDCLRNEVDVITTAHLLGHSNPSMLAKVYAKVQQDPEFMLRAAKKARG